MPWNITVCTEHPIIETHFLGILTPEDLAEAMWTSIAAIRKHGTELMLGNYLALEGGHSIVDLYFVAATLAADGVAPYVKEALLLPEQPALLEYVRFWENTLRNRGFRVRAFGSRDDAVTWLLA